MSQTRPAKLRTPTIEDGAGIFELIRRNPPLDVNSCYLYLLLCKDFADTCVVAEMDGRVAGAVTGYVPPSQSEAVFVWQVAVDEAARGQGLAGRMLEELLSRPAVRDVRFLETTISPSNEPSQRLFRRFAEKHQAELDVRTLFTSDHFGGEQHESEELYRIGPFQRVTASRAG